MPGDLIKIEPVREAHMLPANLGEASRIAEYIAESGLFGCKTKEQAFSLMLLADAEGLHPAAAARDYHIIEGRPSLKADAMLARYMSHGGKVEWLERSGTRVAAKFTHPSSGTVEIEWTWEMAKAIKRKGKSLTEGDNWRNYPRQMLSARVISEGVRASFPSVVAGVYTPEEVQDFEPTPAPSSRRQVVEAVADAEVQVEPTATEAGGVVSDAAPPVSSSVRASFTVDQNDDGIGKGKSASQAKKDGDWERVGDRLREEMSEIGTRPDAEAWWTNTKNGDQEYRNLPSSWRQMFYETEYLPWIENLPEVMGS